MYCTNLHRLPIRPGGQQGRSDQLGLLDQLDRLLLPDLPGRWLLPDLLGPSLLLLRSPLPDLRDL